jgi:hypothetical protein
MSGPAGARDDHLKTGRLGAFGEGDEPIWRAMGGDDTRVIMDAERVQGVGGVPHGGPVRLTAHDDGNGGSCHETLRLKASSRERLEVWQ